MQFVGKRDLFVCLPVVVGVLEDDQFVVRFRISRLPVRIGGHHGHPESAFVVERYLHRIGEVRELHFRRKQIDLVTRCHRELVQRLLSVEISEFGIRILRHIVGFHLGEGRGPGIRSGKVKRQSLGCHPDGRVPD